MTAMAAPTAQPLRSDWASISMAWRWPRTTVSLSPAPGVLGTGPAATASLAGEDVGGGGEPGARAGRRYPARGMVDHSGITAVKRAEQMDHVGQVAGRI